MNRLLYYAPFAEGGLADYADEQAKALANAGVEVTMLTVPEFRRKETEGYAVAAELVSHKARPGGSRTMGRLHTGRTILQNMGRLAKYVRAEEHSRVLMGSYSEYLAPLWSRGLRKLAAEQGVVFGAVIHDPVRDYVVGPLAWHRWSVACGYSYLREAFVHSETVLDTGRPMPQLRTTVIPHGPFPFSPPSVPREVMRERLQLPSEAVVLLAFGFLRDNKNLDLALKAMKEIPSIHLVVAGREQSAGQKGFSYYMELARDLGVADRCRWEQRFIDQGEVGSYFVAADYALLTYSRSFHSASGVLNTAAWFRTPCIVSAGPGSLETVARRYQLGWWAEPDDLESLKRAFRNASRSAVRPDWASYDKENSWCLNASLTIEKMFRDGAGT